MFYVVIPVDSEKIKNYICRHFQQQKDQTIRNTFSLTKNSFTQLSSKCAYLHECSPFWVVLFITFNKENYHVYCSNTYSERKSTNIMYRNVPQTKRGNYLCYILTPIGYTIRYDTVRYCLFVTQCYQPRLTSLKTSLSNISNDFLVFLRCLYVY